MGTAIVVVLALLAVGIVVDQLFRLKNYLQKAPPAEPPKPEDEDPPAG